MGELGSLLPHFSMCRTKPAQHQPLQLFPVLDLLSLLLPLIPGKSFTFETKSGSLHFLQFRNLSKARVSLSFEYPPFWILSFKYWNLQPPIPIFRAPQNSQLLSMWVSVPRVLLLSSQWTLKQEPLLGFSFSVLFLDHPCSTSRV